MPAIRHSSDKWVYENFIRNSRIARTKNQPLSKKDNSAKIMQFWHSRQYCMFFRFLVRNIHSLNNYKKQSIEQQKSISHLLSCYSTQPNPSTSNPILSSTYSSTITDITNQQSQNGGVIMPGCTLHSCTIQIISSPCGPSTKKPKMDSISS